jgi:hypothetical protein
MALYAGISTTAGGAVVTTAGNGVGFEVLVTANPAAYRGIQILVSESYDGTNFGSYKPIYIGNSTLSTYECLQGTNNSFIYLTKASKVAYQIVNRDIQALTATVTATGV